MRRIKLIVAYDGTNYCGWQVQPNGITIEEVLNRELSHLLKENIVVTGASRTDSGVHSLGNVAVFLTDSNIPPEKISFALNQTLPEDIVVQDSREVPMDFHPRRCESVKTYEYKILNCTFRKPLRRNDTYFYHHFLEIERMQEAASYFIGEHDFKSFCSQKTEVLSTVRRILSLEVQKEDDIITIRIQGNGFLYNMVRIIAGTLIQVGNGIIEPQKISEIIDVCDRKYAGPTAPAQGLTMIGIVYF